MANVEEGIAKSEEIGFPVMIKASEGEIVGHLYLLEPFGEYFLAFYLVIKPEF